MLLAKTKIRHSGKRYRISVITRNRCTINKVTDCYEQGTVIRLFLPYLLIKVMVDNG